MRHRCRKIQILHLHHDLTQDLFLYNFIYPEDYIKLSLVMINNMSAIDHASEIKSQTKSKRYYKTLESTY